MSMVSPKIMSLRKDFSFYDRFVIFSNFLNHVRILDKDKCWEWIGSREEHSGYGFFHWEDIHYAHVASYELFIGPRKGKKILHRCDNPPCVNPYHLWRGTQQQNILDMVAKGRYGNMYGKMVRYREGN